MAPNESAALICHGEAPFTEAEWPALLDKRVLCDLLGFDEETYAGVRRLAAKWCAEPSVHGGKARPKGATFVV